ncbi:MAG: molybdenum cofactor biosynthesis protein MoaB [Candidatus Methanomethylicia archaeon]|nr:molybdenum cofactor biosynthesis protein MoaB [Candidatus Methanomethylicia archaeon]
MHQKDHHRDLPKEITFKVIVTSDTISSRLERGEPFEDETGSEATRLIASAGFAVNGPIYLPNRLDAIRDRVKGEAGSGGADVIIISGGTGISPRDITVEAVSPLFDKELPGFGELFRRLSFESIGTSAIASRSTAGLVGRALVFALPGSPPAVRLALEKIILPEAPHLLKMAKG